MQQRPVLKLPACKLSNIPNRSQLRDGAQRLKLQSKVSQRLHQNVNVFTNSCRLRLMSGTALSRTHHHVSEGQLFLGPTNGRESLLCHLNKVWTKTRRPESEYSGAICNMQYFLQQLHSSEMDPVPFFTEKGRD